MKDECNLKEVITKLLKYYNFYPKPEDFLAVKALRNGMHPFGVLISIILTQNTSDRNALKAFERLRNYIGMDLDPKFFKEVSSEKLAELIKPSGMQLIKAKTIKNVLNAFSRVELNNLLELDPEVLRQKLISVKGVGAKTTDVFLLMLRNYPTFPIDTHIRRVLTRLGCVHEGERYENIRKKVIEQLGRNSFLLRKAHIILIIHGRRICTARSPKCNSCPLKEICNFYTSKKNNA